MDAESRDEQSRVSKTNSMRIERRELESQLLKTLLAHTPDYVYFKDLQSRFICTSRTHARVFGLENPEDIIGKSDFDFFSEQHARQAYEDEQEIIRTGEPIKNLEEMETWPDGRVTWVSTTKVPLKNESGGIIGTFGISRDITKHKQSQEALRESEARYRAVSEELVLVNQRLAEANEALQELSLTDPLTGLRNRRFLLTRMPEDIAQVERTHRDLAFNKVERMKLNVDVLFLMVDLDHFKLVNDQHGHLAGDRVLQQVGDILRSAARTTDTVARVGGEEFLIVARQTARVDAHVMPERIRAAVEAHPFDIGEGVPVHCTCSVGFCVFPLLMQEAGLFTWEQIVEVADHCLYAAKRSGRNAWVGIVPDMQTFKDKKRGELPPDTPGLIRSGLLPMVTSIQGPVIWGFDIEER
jgi:diguanylate cyclase (GGDEF)-like protein/PAS domain S-box-containing protein